MSPRDVRQLIREGAITCNTSGMCAGYAQANLCVLPKDLAYDFLLFAQRNPRPCPILEVSDVGSRFLKKIAPGADIANDIPKYRVYENGVMTGEYTSVEHLWRDDFVSFLIGCIVFFGDITLLKNYGFEAIFFLGTFFLSLWIYLRSNALDTVQDGKAVAIDLSLFRSDRSFTIGSALVVIILAILYIALW